MNKFRFKTALAVILLLAAASAALAEPVPARPASPEQMLFEEAQARESAGDVLGAIALYEKAIRQNPSSEFAGEALFRSAALYDERLYVPPLALERYRLYLARYKGRLSIRAAARIKDLARFEKVNIPAYQRYRRIMDLGANKPVEARRQMEAFIAANPKCGFADEAILWLANEIKGFRRGVTNLAVEEPAIRRSMALYQRILDEYPESPVRLAALKNMGDCYRFLGDYESARRYYRKVVAEGGPEGRLLVGEYWRMTNLNIYRNKALYAAVVLFAALFGSLFILLDLDRKSFVRGLLSGLKGAAWLLPVAAALFFVVWRYTDATKDNINGTEPAMVVWIMATAMLALVVNGLAVEADRTRPVSAALYLTILCGMILCLVYAGFYTLDLLPYVEKLFI